MRYIDPDGRMNVDFENSTVTCDINDSKDMQLTADFLAKNKNFSVIGIDSNKGSSYYFSTFEKFNAYRMNPNDIGCLNPLPTEFFGPIISLAYFASDITDPIKSMSGLTKGLGHAGNLLTLIAIIPNIKAVINDPNLDTVSDLVITAFGFAGPEGALISCGLYYGKKGVIFAASEMAKFQIGLEKQMVNSVSRSMFNIDFRR